MGWASDYAASNPDNQATATPSPTASTAPTSTGGWAAQYAANNPENPAAQAQPSGNPVMQGLGQFQSLLKPTSGIDLNDQGASMGTMAADFGGNVVKDLGSILGGIGTAAVALPLGVGGDFYQGVTGNAPQNQYVNAAQKVVNGAPAAIGDSLSGLGSWAKDLVTPGKSAAAVQQGADYAYQHPLGLLSNLSGGAEVAGMFAKGAGKIAGTAADNAALDAVKASLPAEEAATASIGASNNPLMSAGDALSNFSNAINPMTHASNVAGSIRGMAGNVVAKGSSIVNHSGSDGNQAIKAIAGGGDMGEAALAGARGQENTVGQNAFKSAISGIDDSNAVGNTDLQGALQEIRTAVPDIAQEHGVMVNSFSPEESSAVDNYLQQVDLSKQAEATGENVSDPSKLISSWQQVAPIVQKYGLGGTKPDQFTAIENAIKSTRRYGGQGVPLQSDIEDAMRNVQAQNGLVSITKGITDIPSSKLDDIHNAITQLYQTGGSNSAPGFEASANHIQKLKDSFGKIYNDHPLATNSDKAANPLVQNIKEKIDATLSSDPGYANANALYSQGYYPGKALNSMYPTSISGLLKDGPLAAGIGAGMAHFLGPLGYAGMAVGSPRVAAEAANLYGKAARTATVLNAPARKVANSGSLTSILSAIGKSAAGL